jgi:hypothetical protein
MTIAKVRNLSQAGVITDVDPFNIPANAFSMAVNARFRGGSVLRAPVFRRIPLTLAFADPRFVASNVPSSGFDTIYLGYLNGRVTKYFGGTETDVSVFAYVNASSDTPYTTCTLGSVFYVNRQDRVPWALRVTDSVFQTLANWDSTWRANLLRTCGGALVALNVTKGGTSFPTMVKTSEFALVNAVPTTWDDTLTTNNATENILADLHGPIIEAQNLGQQLMIYGLNETWAMTADGSEEVFRYDKLFNDRGAVNANCVVEVDRKHYVFGPNDIWVHDGTSKESICDLKVRDFIFSTINLAKSKRCYVVHDPSRKELRFCYMGVDPYCAFLTAEGCNRCAIYNLVEKTWTFDDLPFTFAAAVSNTDTTLTYDNVTSTYDTIGGTYLDQDDSNKRVLVMVGDVNAGASLSASLYAIDNQGPGSAVPYAVDTNATRPVTLLKDGIDLDELPEVADNRGYKVCSSIFPQARFEAGAQPLMFSFGSADHYNDTVTYSDPQSYDGSVDVRCDFYSGGRFLAMKITHDDYHYFNFTGVDIDLSVTGQE